MRAVKALLVAFYNHPCNRLYNIQFRYVISISFKNPSWNKTGDQHMKRERQVLQSRTMRRASGIGKHSQWCGCGRPGRH